jgi:hypothetical protein
MIKTTKVFVLGLFMTLFSVISYARAIGSLVNGVPVVSVTNEEFQTQINLLSNYGFSNINFVSSSISFNPTASGILFVTYTCNAPGESEEYKIKMSVELTYNSESNEFNVPNGGHKRTCVSSNCSGCEPVSDGCSSCARIDQNSPYSCKVAEGGQEGSLWTTFLLLVFAQFWDMFCC